MFRAKVKSEVLKEIIDVVSTLVDEARFDIDKKGINLKAVDPAHVAMVSMEIKKKAFEEFKADDCELGIDIDKITTGITSSKRDKMKFIISIIKENFDGEISGVHEKDIVRIASEADNIPEGETLDAIQKLMNEGMIYFSRPKVYRVTKT